MLRVIGQKGWVANHRFKYVYTRSYKMLAFKKNSVIIDLSGRSMCFVTPLKH